MKLLYTSVAAIALLTGPAFAQGYTSQAQDTVPGVAVSTSGEMPSDETGATTDGSGVADTDLAAEPELIEGLNDDTNSNVAVTDPAQQDNDMIAGAASDQQFEADQAANVMVTEETRKASGAVNQTTQDIYAAPAPEVALEGWERLTMDEVTTDDLTSATVFDANQEDIGSITELFVSASGELTEAELSVGGYIWGIGATDVRVSMDSLNIQQDLAQGEIRVFVDMTEAALIERAPE